MKLKSILSSLNSELSLSRFSTIAHAIRPSAAKKSAEEAPASDQAHKNFLPGPSTLLRWGTLEIREELGRGAFGAVYRAWDPDLKRDVALKLFPADQGQIEEARKLASVSSPNIVKIYRYESHGGQPGLEMELLKGTTVSEHVEIHGSLACREAAAIVADLCRAVSTVHHAGMLHRDIKAQNVMLEATGQVVLMDFGLGESIQNDAAMRTLAGTLPYMAPELFTGGKASVQTDIYSLGVLLYFLVSSQYPVKGKSIADFRAAHLSSAKTPLRKRVSTLPFAFTRIVDRAIAANHSDRYSSAEEMAAALAGLLQKKPSRNMVLAAVAMMAFIVSAGFYLFRTPAVPERSFTRITTEDGLANEPSISADGQTVAYSADGGGGANLEIWVKRLNEARPRRITYSSTNESEPGLSPDATQVAYRSDRSGGGIYIQDLASGRERLLAPFGHNPVFSPNGMEVAFWTGQSAKYTIPGKVYIVSVNNGTPRQIAAEFKDARFPAWSPDGSEILLQGCGPGCIDPERDTDWWRLHSDGSSPVKTGALQDARAQGLTLYLGSPAWSGNSVIFSARMENSTNLWEIPLEKRFWMRRRAVSLMQSTEEAVNPSVSRNGVIAFSGLRAEVDLWWALYHEDVPLFPERLNRNIEIDSMPTISADGKRLLYFRRIGNSRKMILQEWNGPELMALEVPDGTRGMISPSGNMVAYSSQGKKGRQIYVMRAPSWDPVLAKEASGEILDILDDGNQLLVTAGEGVASLNLLSGQQTLLLEKPKFTIDQATVSPDGKWIAFLAVQEENFSRIYVAPMASSPIHEPDWTPLTQDTAWYDTPRWSRDGRSLIFLSTRDSFYCLWKLRVDTTTKAHIQPQELLPIHSAQISPMHLSRASFNLSVAQDRLLYNAGDVAANIWTARKP